MFMKRYLTNQRKAGKWLLIAICLVAFFVFNPSAFADATTILNPIGPKTKAKSVSVTHATDDVVPLPAGAATAAKQDAQITSLSNLDTDLGAKADTAATTDTGTFSLIALFKRALQALSTISTNIATVASNTPSLVSGRQPVDGSGVTQPISVASLPLPSAAATSTKQSDGTQKTQLVNAAGTEMFTGTLVNSSAYEASRVLKASAGQMVSLVGYNAKTSGQFIQVFNSTTVPADATAPVLTFWVPASSNFSYDVPVTGLPFATGIAVSNSSTGPTKTIGSADCYFTAVVR